MSSLRSHLKITVAAGLLSAIMPVAQAQNRVDPLQAAAVQAQTQRAQAEGGIANNRAAAINTLVTQWQSALPNDVAVSHFKVTLEAASNRTLARVYGATSFEQVRAILLGQTLA